MSKQNTISIVISAYNEEGKIKNCLESVKDLADEIIFVDNSSTDRTAEIAKKYTDKIYVQKNDPLNIDIQKNLGIEKATKDWILVLDADEKISPELKDEIVNILNSELRITGYYIPRKNFIFGKWIQHSGWYPDYQLRLFRNGKGKYEKKHVHEPLNVQGKIEKLDEHIIHANYESVTQFIYKHFLIYAPNEAEELIRRGYVFDWLGAIRMPMSEFLSRYFAREGYKDGFHGFILALLMGFYHLAIFVYIWEKNNFRELDNENILYGINEELKKTKKEYNYWLSTRDINEEKNSFRKIAKKIKRKMQI